MKNLLVIGGMALITFLIRYSMFVVAGRMEFPRWFRDALRYVPPAVLSAIVAPSVLMPTGEGLVLGVGSPHLAGAIAAFVVGKLTGKLLAVIVTGMAVFWIWRAVPGLFG